MDAKEHILKSIAENLQPFIPLHPLIVRNDHGCWEIISRNDNGFNKTLECIMAEDPNDDNLYLHFYENYSEPAKPISLSDPSSIEKLFTEVREKLGYNS